MYALVRTNDRNVYQVRVGNYLGQNFGIITGISEGEIKLRELVQDSSGDWAERQSRLLLDDQEQKK
jgi:type IV pilus assembly protein PilP